MGTRKKNTVVAAPETKGHATTGETENAAASTPLGKPPARRKRATLNPKHSQSPQSATKDAPRDIPHPRLRILKIKNLRCIGPAPVTIELDEIVVLVGPNNAGKSTILFAYELVMNFGSAAGKLKESDFPNGKVDEQHLPEIEIELVVHERDEPGAQWIKLEDGARVVRERWIWKAPDETAKRQGYDVQKDDWSDNVPWGAAGVAKASRPLPHRINAFDSPEEQASKVAKLLTEHVQEQLKAKQLPAQGTLGESSTSDSEYATLLSSLAALQRSVITQARTKIEAAEKKLSDYISEVFKGYAVKFNAREEDDLEKAFSFFKATPQLLMGAEGSHLAPIDRQGSGARRMLMWAALRFMAEDRADDSSNRPHLLLLDEPELCLHPNAIRQACGVLYALSERANWQVMITTHSPVFIDLTRDNTTIIRVSRDGSGAVQGTTLFRAAQHRLDTRQRRELKLLNLCDPSVNEFFFGGRTIIVEGDTEYTAFKHVASEYPDQYRDIHIVRARGKVMVALLARILNRFGTSYAVLHDSDRPDAGEHDEVRSNSAWKINQHIRAEIECASGRVRHLAVLPNFESAILGYEARSEKPYNALRRIHEDPIALGRVRALLDWLLGMSEKPPDRCVEFGSLSALEDHWRTQCMLDASQEGGMSMQPHQPSVGRGASVQSSIPGQLSLLGPIHQGSSADGSLVK